MVCTKLRLLRHILLVLALLSFSVGAEQTPKGAPSSFDKFMIALEEYHADDFSLEKYLRLKALYKDMQQENTVVHKLWFSAQQLAVIDTFFGAYQRAENRQYQVHPGFGRLKNCLSDASDAKAALSILPKLIADRDIVLMNESHTRLSSRALLIGVLPVLKELGFSVLAMEALNPELEFASMQALQKRGYPIKALQEGYYLREPVMAELVREAIALGFTLLPFDLTHVAEREQREEHQAEVLAEFIRANPETKLAVISGYSHIHKSGGWMAERLQQKINKPILSLDQTSRITGCKPFEAAAEPFILFDEQRLPWSALPGTVDLTIIHTPFIDETTSRPAWLRLNGLREPIDVGNELCNETWPCLISAYYSDEQADALPADLVLLEDASSTAWLYLRSGKYRVKGQNMHGNTQQKMIHTHADN